MPTRREFSRLIAGSAIASAAALRPARAQSAGSELLVGFDGAAVVNFVLDPHNSLFAPHNRVLRSIYDNLVVLLPDQTVAPWLAESWEVSPDRKTYVFKLRHGVTFHDGTPFDAAAVKANFDRLGDPKSVLYARPDIGPFEKAEVLQPDTVRITLTRPFEALLRNLSSTKLAIVSPAAVAKYGAVFGQHPVGTGPFRFAGLTQGTEIRLERNADYAWAPPTASHAGPAYIEKLTFRNVPEQATRVAALKSGQVQVADLIPSQFLADVKADPDLRLLQKELLNTNYALSLNVARAPWDDEEIRHAFRLSLDIGTIVRVVYLGTAPRAWSPLSPSIFASAEHELANSWKPDPAKATAILDAKGWITGADGIRVKDGKRLTISFIDTQGNREQRLDCIQLIRRQLAHVGIALTIDTQPAGAYLQKVAAGEFDLSAGAQFCDDPDILRHYYVPAARPAFLGISVNDPDLAKWLEQASVEADAAKRAELYRLAQQRIIDKVYAIPVYVLLYNIAASTSVTGIALDTHGFPHFHGARIVAS
jgi:peptide/nickel transport system substrate-binding protein